MNGGRALLPALSFANQGTGKSAHPPKTPGLSRLTRLPRLKQPMRPIRPQMVREFFKWNEHLEFHTGIWFNHVRRTIPAQAIGRDRESVLRNVSRQQFHSRFLTLCMFSTDERRALTLQVREAEVCDHSLPVAIEEQVVEFDCMQFAIVVYKLLPR